ncbi:DUF1848 domain-containing protein [Desulfobacula toluolica]|uniref:Conserved uncharacterized protein, DUF1848 n=1 Tax=Desulfobacula toluolica (strain DSM 7467 / Tol2) TaxID=651182 RepID=K0NS14_DESTT|nr:DUF1848 domain-containing protein [Desulfobacula toluolica]CCK81762.1 conserved uncharacterized protein, DUF1848 [Desulfobacula toluolica Tol2]
MTQNPHIILSASRRTDIPAFYTDWFMDRIKLGVFNIKNPYTKTIKAVEASKDTIHSIVFWSKNYDAFIKAKAGEKLTRLGFNIYFNFTINSESSLLEPNIPPLNKRLEQLKELVCLFGPEKISWRFDPVCFYKTSDTGRVKNNLSNFPVIAKKASELGIQKCVTSFFDHYPKIKRRLKILSKINHPSVFFTDPAMDKKTQVIHRMEKLLNGTRIKLYLCCEKEVLSNLDTQTRDIQSPEIKSRVSANSCVDGNLLKTIFGGNPELKRDYGQRSKQGCRCTESIDVGSYDDHPCFHNCLFCYANPKIDTTLKNAIQ